jgi:hypothetical protein
MITWLSRQEKITAFRITLTNMQEPKTPKIIKSIAKHPHYRNRSIPVIENLHQAPEFGRHLKQFLNTFITSSTSSRMLDQTNLPPLFSLDVFKLFRFNLESLQDGEDVDLVRAIPVSKSLPNGRFDTVVVIDGDEAEATGLAGTYDIMVQLSILTLLRYQ